MKNHIYKWLDSFIFRCFIIFTIVLILGGIAIKAMYSYDDFPYFTHFTAIDIIVFLIYGIAIICIIRHAETINKKLNLKIVTVLYLAIAVAFIAFLPLIPFSDMQYVSEGALKISNFDIKELKEIAYFKTFKGNIKTSIFYAIPLLLLPNSVFSMKIINILLLLLIAFLTKKIAELLKIPYTKLIFLAVLSFLPVFLFVNNIYYEMFFMTFMMAAFYIYLKNPKNIIISAVMLAIAYYLRKNGLILMIALSLDYFIRLNKQADIKKYILSVMIFFTLSFGMNQVTSNFLYDETALSYPKWNQYYIGINEEKFGFMDQSFSFDRSFNDVIDRAVSYGPIRLGKVLIKKTLWAWTEGTYQSGRYAFGLNTSEGAKKFSYGSPLEKYFMKDTQLTRKIITSFCRVQYMVYFMLMGLALLKYHKREVFRIGGLIFLGTFAALLFYELKSRYVIHCFPFMIMYAFAAFPYLQKKTEYIRVKLSIKKQ